MIKNITTEIFSNLTNSCGTSRASWSWRRVSTQRMSLFPTQHWIWRRKYRSAWLNWIWLSKLEVLYAAPIWNLLLVPLPLFRNQNMPCTQRIPSFSYKRAIQRSKPKVPVLCPTELRVAESYTRDYILIANFVAMLLLPFLIITILNFRLFKTIKV